MELSILRAQETLHLANNMRIKMFDFTNELNSQARTNEEIVSETFEMAERLIPLLQEDERQNLYKILRLIEIVITERLINFGDAMEILEWTTDMAEKYTFEYESLIERYGHELN
jgi:hypothetical protein